MLEASGEFVHLNGRILPKEEALVPVEDRGFLFADGVYEVTPAYGGRFLRFPSHLARLRKGLCELRIDWDAAEAERIHRDLLEANGLTEAPMAIVYLQVTRGSAPRTHTFPSPPVPPTVFAYAKPFRRPPRDRWEQGFSAITVPDQRWARCDLKTVGLLPCVLAQQAAADAGVQDALLVRDGLALEGAHNNTFAVFGDRVATHPASNQILHGVTRAIVLELARAEGLVVEERPIPVSEIRGASEIFFTGTTTEIRPTVQLDGRPVGNGKVGPVTRRLMDAFDALVARETGSAVPVGV